MRRHFSYSFINIAGLALGIACCLVVMLFVQEELRYDRFHENAERIFRITQVLHRPAEDYPSLRPHSWLGPALTQNLPEVENSVRIVRWSGILSSGEDRFDERIFFADPSFFKIFTFPLRIGGETAVLSKPNNIVISRRMAEKYFGEKDPLGRTLILDGKHEFVISGVLEDIPRHSHIKFDFLAPFDHVRNIYGEERFNQGRAICYTYVLLSDTALSSSLARKLPSFLETQRGEKYAAFYTLSLQPLTSIHLQSHFAVELEKNSRLSYTYLLTTVAFLILIVACVNYINLSTARASRRALEVGVRKVIGADKRRLFSQFLGESFLYSLLAAVLGLFLTQLFLPVFNTIMDRGLSLEPHSNLPLWWGLLGVILFAGFLSGCYPALLLASFRPVDIIKGKNGKVRVIELFMRRGLVIVQFVLAVVFIVGALVVTRQVDFIRSMDLGFNKERVLILPPPLKKDSGYFSFKSEILQNLSILELTSATGVPGRYAGLPMNFIPEGSPGSESVPLSYMAVDFDFFKFYGMDIVEGRALSPSVSEDMEKNLLLNETAVKKLGWETALGKQLTEERGGVTGTIVGVVKDFHNVSLHEEIKPTVFQVDLRMFGQTSIRIAPDSTEEVLAFLGQKWSEWAPYNIFYYSFMDEELGKLYQEENKANLVFRFASLLSIFIACLGLFGLSVYSAELRIKEIGIRKTLGATVPGIVRLLSGDFFKLVLISNLIAWPVVYYIMNRWLQNFVYHATLSPWLFVLGTGLTLCISMATVGFQAVKAAVADPVKSFRYE
jgi:putative ABC transport system permease protein